MSGVSGGAFFLWRTSLLVHAVRMREMRELRSPRKCQRLRNFRCLWHLHPGSAGQVTLLNGEAGDSFVRCLRAISLPNGGMRLQLRGIRLSFRGNGLQLSGIALRVGGIGLMFHEIRPAFSVLQFAF